MCLDFHVVSPSEPPARLLPFLATVVPTPNTSEATWSVVLAKRRIKKSPLIIWHPPKPRIYPSLQPTHPGLVGSGLPGALVNRFVSYSSFIFAPPLYVRLCHCSFWYSFVRQFRTFPLFAVFCEWLVSNARSLPVRGPKVYSPSQGCSDFRGRQTEGWLGT